VRFVLSLSWSPIDSEQRTDIWPECVSNPQREHRGNENESDPHQIPEPRLDQEKMIAVLESSALVHVWCLRRSRVSLHEPKSLTSESGAPRILMETRPFNAQETKRATRMPRPRKPGGMSCLSVPPPSWLLSIAHTQIARAQRTVSRPLPQNPRRTASASSSRAGPCTSMERRPCAKTSRHPTRKPSESGPRN
jgi:hypothetical protein